MKVEFLTASNYDEYRSWHMDRAQVPVASDLIPATTYLIRDEAGCGVCAGSIYISEGKEIGWLAWTVTNPRYDMMKRRKAVSVLIEALTNLARDKGCKMVFTSTENHALGRLFTKAGFTSGDDEAIHYMKRTF